MEHFGLISVLSEKHFNFRCVFCKNANKMIIVLNSFPYMFTVPGSLLSHLHAALMVNAVVYRELCSHDS